MILVSTSKPAGAADRVCGKAVAACDSDSVGLSLSCSLTGANASFVDGNAILRSEGLDDN